MTLQANRYRAENDKKMRRDAVIENKFRAEILTKRMAGTCRDNKNVMLEITKES